LATKHDQILFGDQTLLPFGMVWAWTKDECLATKHRQTLFGDQTFYRLDTFFGAV